MVMGLEDIKIEDKKLKVSEESLEGISTLAAIGAFISTAGYICYQGGKFALYLNELNEPHGNTFGGGSIAFVPFGIMGGIATALMAYSLSEKLLKPIYKNFSFKKEKPWETGKIGTYSHEEEGCYFHGDDCGCNDGGRSHCDNR